MPGGVGGGSYNKLPPIPIVPIRYRLGSVDVSQTLLGILAHDDHSF